MACSAISRGANEQSWSAPATLWTGQTRDALVTGYEHLIPALSLPVPNDRHVLAAAITGRCDVIVTNNVRDFPLAACEPFGIRAQRPDDFLCDLLDRAPGSFCGCVRKVRQRLTNPPFKNH